MFEIRKKPLIWYVYNSVKKSKYVKKIIISTSKDNSDNLLVNFLKNNKINYFRGSLVNVEESSIARESDFMLSIAAGPEIGVASTKAFSAQLCVLACLCLVMARDKKKLNKSTELLLTKSLLEIPSKMSSILESSHNIKKYCSKIVKAKSALFLGRGLLFPIAMEGALKLKEISYIPRDMLLEK